MSFRELKAADGCVIFFPSRDSKGKRPNVISGPVTSRPRWGEEWVQFRLDHVELEVRFEGDKAKDLGNGLQCDVVAHVLALIDEGDLSGSLTKIVNQLRCSTTNSLKSVVTESFFRERLRPKFLAAVEGVISQANYLKLLDTPSHIGEMQDSFAEQSKTLLSECGFVLISSDIRFKPLNPGMLGFEREISEKWIERERIQAELEAKRQANRDNMEDVKRREAAERSLRVEQELKAIEVKKKEAERDNAKQIHAIEVDMQNAQDDKERTLAEARRTLDDYFRERQEEKDSYDHSRKIEEGKRRDEILAMDEEAKRLVERASIEHARYLREQELAASQQELELANARLAIAKIESEKTKLLGMMEAEVIESKTKAENVLQHEEARAAAALTERLIEGLPNLAEKISKGDSGDKTVIYFGGDVKPESLGGAGGIVALSLAPVMKQLFGRISDFLSVQSYSPNGKENKRVSGESSSCTKSQDGAPRADEDVSGTQMKAKAEQGH